MKRSAAFEKRSAAFEAGVAKALADAPLQRALADVPAGFVAGRARQKAAMPEFESLRRTARDIRDHTLAHLDAYLEAFERNAEHAGSRVHWASTAAEAGDIILGICRAAGARTVTKSKSMVSEEIELNARLEAVAIEVVETDLGEYLIQLRGERPSHIIAPAIHLRPDDVANEFRACHVHLPAERDLSTPEAMVAEARGVLREKFLAADVGITGANFLVAATGSAIVVTNEGNADLTMSLPKVHIVLATIDKVVPTFDDAWPLLRLLARSATGQAFTAYTTIVTGPRQPLDDVGPESCHVVILDNGRSELLRSSFRPGAALHPLWRPA
ncbi:MAG: LUD domain-containing protein [Hyphomicrobium sp.]